MATAGLTNPIHDFDALLAQRPRLVSHVERVMDATGGRDPV